MEKCKTCKLYDFCHTYPVIQFREFPGRDGNLYPNCYKPKEEKVKEKNEILYTGEQFEKLIRDIVKEEIRKQQTAKMPYGFFQKGKEYLRTKPSKTGDPIYIGIRLQFIDEDSYYFYFLCLSTKEDIELNKNDYNDVDGWLLKPKERTDFWQKGKMYQRIKPSRRGDFSLIGVRLQFIKEDLCWLYFINVFDRTFPLSKSNYDDGGWLVEKELKKPLEIDQPILWTGLQEQKILEVIKHYTDALKNNDFSKCFRNDRCPFCIKWNSDSLLHTDCPNYKINELLFIIKSETDKFCSANNNYFFYKDFDEIKESQKKKVTLFRLELWLDSLYMPKGQFIAKYKKT